MALIPIAYIEKIAKSFLRYQLAACPFSDPRLLAQMRDLLRSFCNVDPGRTRWVATSATIVDAKPRAPVELCALHS